MAARSKVLLWTLTLLGRTLADVPLIAFLVWLAIPQEGSGGVPAILTNVALFLAFGAVHSLLARSPAKRVVARVAGELAVRPIFIAVAGTSLVALVVLWQQPGGVVWRLDGVLSIAIYGLYALGGIGLIVSAFGFDYLEFLGVRQLVRAFEGRAQRPNAFSVRGPYAYCRHPQYSILLLMLWTTPVMTVGRLELAALASIYLLVGTFLEERNLRAELGPEYAVYQQHVPMWIPRLRPWRGPVEG